MRHLADLPSGGELGDMTATVNRRPAASPRRVPPHNLEAEMSLLGAILLSRDAVAVAFESIEPEHFYRPLHRSIFQAMWDLYRRSEPVDAISTAVELRRGGELEQIGGLN